MSEEDNDQQMCGLCWRCIEALELTPKFDLNDWRSNMECHHCGRQDLYTYHPKTEKISKMDDALKEHTRLVDKLDAAVSKWNGIRHSASQFSIDWKCGALSDLSFAAWKLMKFLNDGASYFCADCVPMPLEDGMFFRNRKCDKCGKQTMCYEHKVSKDKKKLYFCEKCDTCLNKKNCWFCFKCKCDKCGQKTYCAAHRTGEVQPVETKKSGVRNVIEQ